MTTEELFKLACNVIRSNQSGRKLIKSFQDKVVAGIKDLSSIADISDIAKGSRKNGTLDILLFCEQYKEYFEAKYLPANYESIRNELYANLQTSFYGKFEMGEEWPEADISTTNIGALAVLKPADKILKESDETQLNLMKSHISKSLMKMSDLTADIMDIIFSEWLKKAKDPEQMVLIHADTILQMRSLSMKKSAYKYADSVTVGYESIQRKEVLEHIDLLYNTWVRFFEITETGGKKSRVLGTEIPALEIKSRTGEVNELGELDPFLWSIKPGVVFIPFLIGDKKQTAIMSRKILNYDPHKYWLEKRLARYLYWQWPIISTNPQYTKAFVIGDLLKSIKYETYSGKHSILSIRFEKALNNLQNDGIISNWSYIGDLWEPIYENREVIISPPAMIIRKYTHAAIQKKKEIEQIQNKEALYKAKLLAYKEKHKLGYRKLEALCPEISYKTWANYLNGLNTTEKNKIIINTFIEKNIL